MGGGRTAISLALFIGTCWPTLSSATAAERVDVSYIPSDSFFALVVHPSRALQHAPRDRESRDFLIKMMKDQTGIDVRNIKQWVIHFGGPSNGEEEEFSIDEEAAMVCHFEKPVDREAILARGFSGATETVYQGIVFYQPTSEWEPSVFFADEQTMVVANADRLKTFIGEKQSMSPLVHRLRTADPQADVHMVITVSTARDVVAEFFESIEFGETGIAPDPDQLTLVSLKMEFSNNVPAELRLTANSATSAEDLKKQVDSLLQLARASLPISRQQIIEDAPNKRLGELTFETAKRALAGAMVSVSGNQVLLRLEVPGGFPDFVDLLSESFAATMQELNDELVVEIDGAIELNEVPGYVPALPDNQ